MKYAERVESATKFILKLINEYYNEGRMDYEVDLTDSNLYLIANYKGVYLKLYSEYRKQHDEDTYPSIKEAFLKMEPIKYNKLLQKFDMYYQLSPYYTSNNLETINSELCLNDFE